MIAAIDSQHGRSGEHNDDRAAGAFAIDGVPRLEPVRTEEAKQGWDWHNELSAFSLELRRILDEAQNDKARTALLKDMRRVLEKR